MKFCIKSYVFVCFKWLKIDTFFKEIQRPDGKYKTGMLMCCRLDLAQHFQWMERSNQNKSDRTATTNSQPTWKLLFICPQWESISFNDRLVILGVAIRIENLVSTVVNRVYLAVVQVHATQVRATLYSYCKQKTVFPFCLVYLGKSAFCGATCLESILHSLVVQSNTRNGNICFKCHLYLSKHIQKQQILYMLNLIWKHESLCHFGPHL